MATIDLKSLEEMLKNGPRPMLVDVRSPSEYATGHIAGALNIPLEEVESRVDDLRCGVATVVVCESGQRADMAVTRLRTQGIEACALVGSTAAWRHAGNPLVSCSSVSWSLERQVRLGAGLLVLTGTLLGAFAHPAWLALSGFVGAGLSFAGLTNICGMAAILQKMPWNRPAPLCVGLGTEAAR